MGEERDVDGQGLRLRHKRAKMSVPDERLHPDQVCEERDPLDLGKELLLTDRPVQARQVKLVGVPLKDGLVADGLRASTGSRARELLLQPPRLVVVIQDKAESFALDRAE